ncbi:serine acetyltransferase [bacterium]|jgi:serine O-acetyltransferase|nr:serine acetyltransferase [bacterium]
MSTEQDYLVAIQTSYESLGGVNAFNGEQIPSRESISQLLGLLRTVLFPGFFHPNNSDLKMLLLDVRSKLSDAVCQAMCWQRIVLDKDKKDNDCHAKSTQIVDRFLTSVPDLRKTLFADIEAIYNGDPAAKGPEEIIVSYPGFQSVMVYRMAHFLYKEGVSLIPRMMTELVHSSTGIDIHPAAVIGESFCMDHGTGIVIGETSVIGKHVKLYQGVTIGALSVPKRGKSKGKRHPTIEDNVTIYARTTILGGDTVVGKGSVIGGNVWLTESVPEFSKVSVAHECGQIKGKLSAP